MKIHPFAALILQVEIATVFALPQYAERIPNGYSVPNPGPQGGVFAGVGHVNAAGGGDRNQFGLDFAANGHIWTESLCKLDSDGDGRTNGEELGDPDCLWSEGVEAAGPAVSHPGLVDEPKAQESNHCDDYVAPDDELTMDIGFSAPTQMDGSQTHYICEQMVVDVPAQASLHKIKHAVLLDNSEVLHHMFVFICPEGTTSAPDGDRVGQGQYECTGNESGCRRIGGWAVGPRDSCEPPNVGVDVDFSGLSRVVVKVAAHYDNTSGQPQQDQSAIRLHMTPTLRPLSGSTTMVGMAPADNNFVIPAQETSYPLSNICPTAITENLEKPVYVYAFTPHMHLYGKSLVTEHYRCGKKIGEIGRITAYEFDNQQTYTLDPPVKILPGDSYVTRCGFDTSSVDFEVRGGDETTDEMCLNFLSVYPNPGTEASPALLSACLSFENGREGTNRRVALADLGGQTFADQFESDPSSNMGSCCAAANNCEELYMAVEGEACGVSDDCMDNLICKGGMCAPQIGEGDKGAICKVSGDCMDDLVCSRFGGLCDFPSEEELPPPPPVEASAAPVRTVSGGAAILLLALINLFIII